MALWDSATLGTGVVLSNGDTTATNSGGNTKQGAKSNSTQNSGKVYVEFNVAAASADRMGVGIGNGDADYTNMSDGLAEFGVLAFHFSGGTIYYNDGTTHVTMGGVGANTVCMAVDIDNKLIWFRSNSGNWNDDGAADPATGTNGVSFNLLSGPWYLWAELQDATDAVTLVTSGFTYSAPVGFGEWESPSSEVASSEVASSEVASSEVASSEVASSEVASSESASSEEEIPSSTLEQLSSEAAEAASSEFQSDIKDEIPPPVQVVVTLSS